MGANDPNSSKPSWRGRDGQSSQAASALKKSRIWTKKQDRSYERAVFLYRLKIAGWAVLFLALTVVFIVYITRQHKRTPLVLAAVTDYESPVPPNGWAREDIKRLQQLDQDEIVGFPKKYADWANVAWRDVESGKHNLHDQMEEAMREATRLGPGQVVIVYLSMHGVVNGDNEPCLLPPTASDASPLNGDKWLRVADLLDELFPKHAEKLPKNVLLLLDCSRIDVDWHLGVLHNNFAERLHAVVEEKQREYPGLAVLTSAGPGQIGWTAPELGGSVFGYYVWRGLRGEADGWLGKSRDGSVSLRELDAYVREKVAKHVREHRADVQEPMLIASGGDYPLVYAKSTKGIENEATAVDNPQWSDLESLWLRHADLRRQSPWRSDPLRWARFQQGLLRMEQLLQCGEEYKDQYNRTKKDVEALANDLTAEDRNVQEAFSLPMARRLLKWPSVREAEEVKTLSGPWSKPNTTAAKPDSAKTPAEKADLAKVETVDYPRAATAAWKWFLNDSVHDPKQCDDVLKYVGRASPRPKTDVIELHFLRMLRTYLDPDVWDTARDQVVNALVARDQAEAAAAPRDDRALYWSRLLVDKADGIRRKAEDGLFIGSPQAMKEAKDRWTQVNGKNGEYQAAIDLNDEIADAFELRDRAWSELPDLVKWQLKRSRGSRDSAAMADLADLIASSRQVGTGLETAIETGDWTAARASVAALKEKLNRQERVFREACSSLVVETGLDMRTLRDTFVALECPLATGADRNSLRKRWLDILKRGRESALASQGETASDGAVGAAAAGDAKSPESSKPLEGDASSLELLKAFREVHPALMILEREKLESQQKSLAKQGERVRWLLKTIAQEAKNLANAKHLAASGAGEVVNPRVAARSGLSQADRLVRVAAPWVESWRPDKNWQDPVGQLRDFDLCHLLLWHAERSMDDFWGPKPGDKESDSFFRIAAESYLKSARKWERAVVALDPESALNKRLTERLQAAIRLEKPREVFVDQKEPFVPLHLSVGAAGNLPVGQCAVYLELEELNGVFQPLSHSEHASKPDQRRMGLAVPGGALPPTCWISNDGRLKEGLPLRMVALYRGHVQKEPFAVLPAVGVDVVYKPPRCPKPTIVVRGDERQRPAIMFILDCSGSMKELVQDENGKKTSRLDAAREKLMKIFGSLAASASYDVGLLAYAHRVGWAPEDQPDGWAEYIFDPIQRKLVRKDSLSDDKRPPWANTVHPWNDVQLLRAVAPLEKRDLADLRKELWALRPVGETPLYLAICRAIGDLSAVDMHDSEINDDRESRANRELHIVAVTDGVNNQETGKSPSADAPDAGITVLGKVEESLKLHSNVHLDVLGFSLNKDTLIKQERDELELFEKLATDLPNAVKFFYTDDPTNLLKALERSLKLSRYEVFNAADGQRVTPEPLDLNIPCVIEQQLGIPVPYKVELVADSGPSAQSEVRLEGGEAIELYVERNDEGRRRLVHRRYTTDIRKPFYPEIRSPLDNEQFFFMAAHLPKRQPDAVCFYVSIQNNNEKEFSPRPAEAWVEVRPVVTGDAQAAERRSDSSAQRVRDNLAYVFYDACYEYGLPAPLLCCRAPNWPRDVKEAEISVWCKMSKTPGREVSVRDFQERPPQLEALLNVSFDIKVTRARTLTDLCQVEVVEHHLQDDDLHTVKVEMSPLADEVRHTYYPKTGTVRHVFFYPPTAADKLEQYTVRLTARDALQADAIAPAKPFVVTIPEL